MPIPQPGTPEWDAWIEELSGVPRPEAESALGKVWRYGTAPVKAFFGATGGIGGKLAGLVAPEAYERAKQTNLEYQTEGRGAENASFLEEAAALPGLGDVISEALPTSFKESGLGRAVDPVGRLLGNIGGDPTTYLSLGASALTKGGRVLAGASEALSAADKSIAAVKGLREVDLARKAGNAALAADKLGEAARLNEAVDLGKFGEGVQKLFEARTTAVQALVEASKAHPIVNALSKAARPGAFSSALGDVRQGRAVSGFAKAAAALPLSPVPALVYAPQMLQGIKEGASETLQQAQEGNYGAAAGAGVGTLLQAGLAALVSKGLIDEGKALRTLRNVNAGPKLFKPEPAGATSASAYPVGPEAVGRTAYQRGEIPAYPTEGYPVRPEQMPPQVARTGTTLSPEAVQAFPDMATRTVEAEAPPSPTTETSMVPPELGTAAPEMGMVLPQSKPQTFIAYLPGAKKGFEIKAGSVDEAKALLAPDAVAEGIDPNTIEVLTSTRSQLRQAKPPEAGTVIPSLGEALPGAGVEAPLQLTQATEQTAPRLTTEAPPQVVNEVKAPPTSYFSPKSTASLEEQAAFYAEVQKARSKVQSTDQIELIDKGLEDFVMTAGEDPATFPARAKQYVDYYFKAGKNKENRKASSAALEKQVIKEAGVTKQAPAPIAPVTSAAEKKAAEAGAVQVRLGEISSRLPALESEHGTTTRIGIDNIYRDLGMTPEEVQALRVSLRKRGTFKDLPRLGAAKDAELDKIMLESARLVKIRHDTAAAVDEQGLNGTALKKFYAAEYNRLYPGRTRLGGKSPLPMEMQRAYNLLVAHDEQGLRIGGMASGPTGTENLQKKGFMLTRKYLELPDKFPEGEAGVEAAKSAAQQLVDLEAHAAKASGAKYKLSDVRAKLSKQLGIEIPADASSQAMVDYARKGSIGKLIGADKDTGVTFRRNYASNIAPEVETKHAIPTQVGDKITPITLYPFDGGTRTKRIPITEYRTDLKTLANAIDPVVADLSMVPRQTLRELEPELQTSGFTPIPEHPGAYMHTPMAMGLTPEESAAGAAALSKHPGVQQALSALEARRIGARVEALNSNDRAVQAHDLHEQLDAIDSAVTTADGHLVTNPHNLAPQSVVEQYQKLNELASAGNQNVRRIAELAGIPSENITVGLTADGAVAAINIKNEGKTFIASNPVEQRLLAEAKQAKYGGPRTVEEQAGRYATIALVHEVAHQLDPTHGPLFARTYYKLLRGLAENKPVLDELVGQQTAAFTGHKADLEQLIPYFEEFSNGRRPSAAQGADGGTVGGASLPGAEVGGYPGSAPRNLGVGAEPTGAVPRGPKLGAGLDRQGAAAFGEGLAGASRTEGGLAGGLGAPERGGGGEVAPPGGGSAGGEGVEVASSLPLRKRSRGYEELSGPISKEFEDEFLARQAARDAWYETHQGTSRGNKQMEVSDFRDWVETPQAIQDHPQYKALLAQSQEAYDKAQGNPEAQARILAAGEAELTKLEQKLSTAQETSTVSALESRVNKLFDQRDERGNFNVTPKHVKALGTQLKAVLAPTEHAKIPKILSDYEAAARSPQKRDAFVDMLDKLQTDPTKVERALTVFKAGLLGWPSRLSSVGSNVMMQGLNTTEHGVATLLDKMRSKLTGKDRTIFAEEIPLRLQALREALVEAFPALKKREIDAFMLRPEDKDLAKLSINDIGRASQAPFKGKLGELFTYQFKGLDAEDAFFRAITRNQELHSLTLRAIRNGKLKMVPGMNLVQSVVERVKEIKSLGEDFSQDLAQGDYRFVIAKEAAERAARSTLQSELGPMGKSFQQLLRNHPSLQFIFPFFRTPANAAKEAINRTPIGFVTTWKKYRKGVFGEVGSPEAVAKMQEELAKPLLASTIGGAVFAMAVSGDITGAGSPDPNIQETLKASGWQPYSIKLGDNYYSYQRFEPISSILGMAADMAEGWKNGELDTAQGGFKRLTASVAENLTNKTFLSGLDGAVTALSDPIRYAGTWAKQMEASLVPNTIGPVPFGHLARGLDPTFRQTEAFSLDPAIAKIPGASMLLPEQYTPTGEPRTRPGSALERIFSPMARSTVTSETDAAVAQELARVGWAPQRPRNVYELDGRKVRLTDAEVKALADANAAAMKEVATRIQSRYYKSLPDNDSIGIPGEETKAELLSKIVRRHRMEVLRKLKPELLARAKQESKGVRV